MINTLKFGEVRIVKVNELEGFDMVKISDVDFIDCSNGEQYAIHQTFNGEMVAELEE